MHCFSLGLNRFLFCFVFIVLIQNLNFSLGRATILIVVIDSVSNNMFLIEVAAATLILVGEATYICQVRKQQLRETQYLLVTELQLETRFAHPLVFPQYYIIQSAV